MAFFPIFLSVVYVVRNLSDDLEAIFRNAEAKVSGLVSDYEFIIVDNASNDNSVELLRGMASDQGLSNLQVFALIKEVDVDTASWVGLENALGDFVVVIDPLIDDIGFLPEMLDRAVSGVDVVFANNQQKPEQKFSYRCMSTMFNALYRSLIGVDLAKEAPQYRLLSKRVVNFILQHPQPAITYRHFPATGGFLRANLDYSATPIAPSNKRLRESIDRGIRLLVSTTRGPMRLVTSLCFFGAVANLIYSVYVMGVGLFKADVAPGWVSLSLQQSGMFFLFSLVLFVLGEYILHMARLSNEGPAYHVGQEFTSVRMTRREKLNIEDPGKFDETGAA